MALTSARPWRDDESYREYQTSLRLEYDRSIETIYNYEFAWRAFLQFLPDSAGLDKVPEAVALYRDDLRIKRCLKEATVYARLSAVRSYFGWLYVHGHIKVDPLDRLQLPRRTANPRSIPTPEVMKVVLPKLRSLPRRDRIVIALAVYAGLRASEIRNLNVESIDLKKNEIHVRNAKGHKDRDVYLHPELAKILRDEIDSELRAERCPCCGYGEGGPLLPGTSKAGLDGQRISKNQPWKAVKTHFPEFSTHDLRALFITVALEHGVPLEEVQEQAGHESANTTVRYKGRRNEYAKAQLRRVDFTTSPPKAEHDEQVVNLQRWRPNGRRS